MKRTIQNVSANSDHRLAAWKKGRNARDQSAEGSCATLPTIDAASQHLAARSASFGGVSPQGEAIRSRLPHSRVGVIAAFIDNSATWSAQCFLPADYAVISEIMSR